MELRGRRWDGNPTLGAAGAWSRWDQPWGLGLMPEPCALQESFVPPFTNSSVHSRPLLVSKTGFQACCPFGVSSLGQGQTCL